MIAVVVRVAVMAVGCGGDLYAIRASLVLACWLSCFCPPIYLYFLLSSSILSSFFLTCLLSFLACLLRVAGNNHLSFLFVWGFC